MAVDGGLCRPHRRGSAILPDLMMDIWIYVVWKVTLAIGARGSGLLADFSMANTRHQRQWSNSRSFRFVIGRLVLESQTLASIPQVFE
jgi:hypothetical protein